MAGAKFLNLLAVSSLAILACSFGASPVNALGAEGHSNIARHAARGHDAVAKRKRTNTKRCKPRGSKSPVAVTPSPIPAPDTAKPTKDASGPVKETPKPADPTNAPAPTKDQPAPAPAPTPTKAPAPAPPKDAPKPAPVSGGGKVGLAWPNPPSVDIAAFATKKVNFCYTWSPWTCSKGDQSGLTSVPMLWGWKQADEFKKKVVKGYATHALGFNEPNQHDQSAMDPKSAAQLWKSHLQPLKSQGYTLISPAVTSAPDGKVWMQNFMKECDGGCSIDRIALHWYGTEINEFIKYVEDFHTTFGLPIWVTEYACQNFSGGAQCDAGKVWDFTNKWVAFADGAEWIEAYFPFGFMHDMVGVNGLNQLMNGAGKPNDLAAKYIY